MTKFFPSAVSGLGFVSDDAVLPTLFGPLQASVSAPVNTAAPVVSGTVQVGQTLSATTGSWSNAPSSYAYQWKAGGTNISGATNSTYVPTNTEHGSTITVAVTASNAGGSATSTSGATSAVVYAAPTNSVAPAITGTATEGQVLTASTGTWSGSGITYTYQWKRAGSAISGATASTYTLVTVDVGNTITASVTATNDGGAATATSSATGTVASGYTFPLDAIGTTSTAAFGLRKLRSAYAGNCIKVRRSNDNATQNIGFSGNELDTASLATFLGSNSGYIDTWYDQSGNARDATQATTTIQPRITLSGTLDTLHSKPVLYFDGVNRQDRIDTPAASAVLILGSSSTSMSCVAFGKAITGSAGFSSSKWSSRGLWSDTSQNEGFTFYASGGTNQFNSWTYGDTNGFHINVTYPVEGVFTMRNGSSVISGTINGNSGTETTATSTPVSPTGVVRIGGVAGSGSQTAYMDGYVGDLIFYAATLSKSDLNAVSASVASYYAQTWTTVT